MSAGDGNAPRRSSVLKNFSAVPDRAKEDTRLKPRHWRVLNALCRRINPETGYVHITYRKVGQVAKYRYQKIGKVMVDLEAFGYIRIEKRGRRGGKYRAFLYEVLYDVPEARATSTPTGGTGPVPLRGVQHQYPYGGYESRVRR